MIFEFVILQVMAAGVFSNIMFQKIICHKSNIYDFCVFQYYLYGCILEKTRRTEKSSEKFSKKKIKRTLFFADIGNSQKVTANLLLPKFLQ